MWLSLAENRIDFVTLFLAASSLAEASHAYVANSFGPFLDFGINHRADFGL